MRCQVLCGSSVCRRNPADHDLFARLTYVDSALTFRPRFRPRDDSEGRLLSTVKIPKNNVVTIRHLSVGCFIQEFHELCTFGLTTGTPLDPCGAELVRRAQALITHPVLVAVLHCLDLA